METSTRSKGEGRNGYRFGADFRINQKTTPSYMRKPMESPIPPVTTLRFRWQYAGLQCPITSCFGRTCPPSTSRTTGNVSLEVQIEFI